MTMIVIQNADRRSPLDLHVSGPAGLSVVAAGESASIDLEAGEALTVTAEEISVEKVDEQSMLARIDDAVVSAYADVVRGGMAISDEAVAAYHRVLDAVGLRDDKSDK